MILSVNKKEAAAMSLHMAIMRKSVLKMLKKRHAADKKSWLASFDYVKKQAGENLENEHGYLHLNIKDVEILHEFIRAYLERIAKDKEMQKQFEKEKEQLQLLTGIKERCEELIQDAS